MNQKKDDALLVKYQKLYAEDIHSRVFAPLAEIYRQRGRFEEALQICQNGIKRHSSFVGAHITLGRIYLETQKVQEACKCFIKAIQLAPENILVHSLLARCWLRLNQSQKAIQSLKTILFLNPGNLQIQKALTQLENSTANPQKEDLFNFLPHAEKGVPSQVSSKEEKKAQESNPSLLPLDERRWPRELEKYLSLIDAFIHRREVDKALIYLEKIEEKWSQNREVQSRRKILMQSIKKDASEAEGADIHLKKRSPQAYREDQIKKMENLLLRVQKNRQQFKLTSN